MARGKAKGSSFERAICKQLSLWWSDGEIDDLYWRTASSGGRSTQRSKQGKSSRNSAGDIASIDNQGRELTDKIAIEVKRGYNAYTFADMIEVATNPNTNPCVFDKFILQTKQAQETEDKPYWWLISKRDRKDTILTMPTACWNAFLKWEDADYKLHQVYPIAFLHCLCKSLDQKMHLTVVSFDSFCKHVPAKLVLKI